MADSWNNEGARELLVKLGRTKRWLAEQCGIELTSLNVCLQGRAPGRPVLKLMALALETTEEFLANGGQSEQRTASG